MLPRSAGSAALLAVDARQPRRPPLLPPALILLRHPVHPSSHLCPAQPLPFLAQRLSQLWRAEAHGRRAHGAAAEAEAEAEGLFAAAVAEDPRCVEALVNWALLLLARPAPSALRLSPLRRRRTSPTQVSWSLPRHLVRRSKLEGKACVQGAELG